MMYNCTRLSHSASDTQIGLYADGVMIVCVPQRTRGQKRKRVPMFEDREDKIEVCHFIHQLKL